MWMNNRQSMGAKQLAHIYLLPYSRSGKSKTNEKHKLFTALLTVS